MVARRLPVGTVTFLFADVEGSSDLLRVAGESYDDLLIQQREMLRDAVESNEGYLVEAQSDSIFAAFTVPSAAVEAALEGQRAMLRYQWPRGMPVRVRMGLHSGEVRTAGERYVGVEVHRAARIGDAGHGGQILMSEATRLLLGDALPSDVRLLDMGQHRLKDLSRTEPLYQVTVDDLPVDFPPLRTVAEERDRLQVPLSAFIGREREKEDVRRLLRSDEIRLLTLTGAGGSGKTRLAIEVAAELQDQLEGGVVFVPLASVSSYETVTSALLQETHMREVAGREPLDTIKDFVRDRNMLLVLDNFEHVLEAAPLLAELLAESDRLKILVTSREVLRLSLEHEYPVPPLTVPENQSDLVSVTESEAVRLFVDRARAVQRGFELTSQNMEAVVGICRLLDGLPLAIELAAARVRILSPDAIKERLEKDYEILAGGPRDLPERQRALSNTIEWSYRMLDDTDRELFECLGVFAGGWSLDAMLAVCADAGDPHVLEGLASLVDKSLVYRQDEIEGESRFAMLRSIRDFAVQRLEERDAASACREAHAEYFRRYARDAEPDLRSSRQQRWLDGLTADIDNFRAAIRWSHEKGDYGRIADIGWSVWPYCWMLNRFNEGQAWMDRALEGEALSQDLRGKALVVKGILAFGGGQYDVGGMALQKGLEISRATGNDLGVGLALAFLGVVSSLGDSDMAWDLIGQAREKFIAVSDEWGISFSLFCLGWVRITQDKLDEAVELLETSLVGMRKVGERVSIAFIHITIGLARLALRDGPGAEETFVTALRLLTRIKDTVGTARALEGLAGASLLGGDAERAAVLFGAAEGARRTVGADVWLLDTNFHMQIESDIRATVGEANYERLYAEGTKLTPEEAQPLATAAATPA